MYVRPVRIARFARFCATKCYYYSPYMYVHPGVIAFFARFCATKMLYSAYINVGTRGIAFARVLHGLPNPLVSRAPKKELSRLREFPPSLRTLDQANLSVIKVFFCAKRGLLPRKRGGLKSASKNHFQTNRGSWARKSSSCLTAAGLPRLVSRPAALPLPCAPAAPASAGSCGPPCCGWSWSPRPPAAARRRTEG